MEFLVAETTEELESRLELRDTAMGKGVFAKTSFEVGDIIALVSGKIIDDPEYNSSYCIDLGSDLSLEPDPPFRYINHRCEPNCCLVAHVDEDDENEDPEELALYVTTTIYPGEEITIDYAWPAESAIPCHCDSVHCRGWIVDTDELDELKEYQRRQDEKVMEPTVAGQRSNADSVKVLPENSGISDARARYFGKLKRRLTGIVRFFTRLNRGD